MKKYKEHIKKHWYCFLLAPIFMTLEAAGEFILPFINANIIDQGPPAGISHTFWKTEFTCC